MHPFAAVRVSFLILALTFLISCSSSPLPGTDAQMRDIDRFVGKTLQTLPEIPSIGLSIVHDGKTYARGYGYADLATKRPSDADTIYYNGSNTKAYTALLCTVLAEEGVLDLDVPVTTYLPELRFPPEIDASRVTLRRLLSHTSNIQNNAIVYRTAFTGDHTPQELVRILGLSTPRNEDFRYDNLGYVVASLVVERLTGQKWQDALASRVFKPLGMTRTTAYMSAARKQRIATPYDMSGTGAMAIQEYGWKDDSMMHAAGGIATTPADVAKFLNANLTQGRIGSRQVIPAAAFAETHKEQTPAKRDSFIFDGTGYGFGWYQSDLHGEKAIYHGGGFEGWRSVYSFLPGKKMAVGAMTNAGLSHSPLELVSAYAYDRLLNVPDVDKTYTEKLAELRARFDTVKANTVAEVEKLAARKWMLGHPLSAYTGRYEGATYGTLTVEQRGTTLVASIGRLSGELTPFTEAESARVELIPGTGSVLRFVFTSADKADAVKFGEEMMTRK